MTYEISGAAECLYRNLRFVVFSSLLSSSILWTSITAGWAASADLPPQSQSYEEDSLAVAYDCLAAIARYSHGADGMLERAKSDGDALLHLAKLDGNKRSGWPYIQRATPASKKCGQPGSLDAFGDSTCNPPETPYTLETGYAITCLAQLGIATGDTKYLKVAKKAIADSWDVGVTTQGCKDCFYYWYSYHANDINRYVRNPNLAMGLGIAWMYAATGDAMYRDRALSIARAEHREIRAGNFGYFGIDDQKYRANPKSEAQRIENHIPHQVKGLKDIGILLGNAQALDDAKVMLDSFLNCQNERCRPDNCSAWAAPPACKATATIAPCILAERGNAYKSRCASVVEELPRLNAFQIFLLDSTSEKLKLYKK